MSFNANLLLSYYDTVKVDEAAQEFREEYLPDLLRYGTVVIVIVVVVVVVIILAPTANSPLSPSSPPTPPPSLPPPLSGVCSSAARGTRQDRLQTWTNSKQI
jgi:hypothetical protein